MLIYLPSRQVKHKVHAFRLVLEETDLWVIVAAFAVNRAFSC